MQEHLTVLKMNTDERNTYFYYLKEAVHSQDVLTAAEAKGKVKGIEQSVLNMLKQKLDTKLITSVTGLSEDDILKLKNKI